MSIFYHLDRSELLHAGFVIRLMPLPLEGRKQEEREAFLRLYPSGVTRFGLSVVHKQPEEWTNLTLEREINFERVRLTRFPACPSRYVSVFACEDIEALIKVRSQFDLPYQFNPRGCIWKIEGTSHFWGDMNWCPEWDRSSDYALCEYWSQRTTDRPIIEHLLAPPVTVLEPILDA